MDRLLRRPILSTSKPLHSLYIFQAGVRPAIISIRATRPASSSSASSSPIPPKDSSLPRRRAVTIVNDTGRVPWSNLSPGEKLARTTQQSFNFAIVAVGVLLTAGVATVLWLEVFSTDSKTATFNRAADRIRADPQCRQLLAGEGVHSKREISAYGEPSWSRWARNRTIASRVETDRAGVEHLHMHFYVQGPVAEGTVQLHMARRPGEDFQYQLLALDVPGQKRVYLEDAHAKSPLSKKTLFGVNWNR